MIQKLPYTQPTHTQGWGWERQQQLLQQLPCSGYICVRIAKRGRERMYGWEMTVGYGAKREQSRAERQEQAVSEITVKPFFFFFFDVLS